MGKDRMRGRSVTRRNGNPASGDRFVDEYGFYISGNEKKANEEYNTKHGKEDGKTATRREQKWRKMFEKWRTVPYELKKSRCRKGIPPSVRGLAWRFLLGHALDDEWSARVVYTGLVARELDAETAGIIERDLPRTFPTHTLFVDDNSEGQAKLRNILHAYACSEGTVGYVQGMGFLAATLLTQISDEVHTFWAFHELMENPRYNMREIYRHGFPYLHVCFDSLQHLIHEFNAPLHHKMESFHIEPSFFASQWFLTLFSYNLSFSLLLRIWDMFFCEGWKIIYRIGITLLSFNKNIAKAASETDLLVALKEVNDRCDHADPDGVLHHAMTEVNFKTKMLRKWERKYLAKQKKAPST